MKGYVARRLLLFIPTLLSVATVIFILLRIVPGDAAIAILAGEGGDGSFTEAELRDLQKRLGLDRPIIIQYLDWLKRTLTLDFGNSLQTSEPIMQEFKQRFPLTLELALLTLCIAFALGIIVGVLSAVWQDTWVDYLFRAFAIAGLAMPTFWICTLIILVLSVWFNWFPPIGFAYLWEAPAKNLKQLIWPALGLGYYLNAAVARMTRSQVLEVLREDYVRTAWAKGLSARRVVLVHALKNALLPVLTITGLQLGGLLGGTIIVETVFNLPGLGSFLIAGVSSRDYPVVQALVFFIAFIFLSVNLLVDITYAWIDPRIRYG
jgi:peptide/nickel transport system permease protein